MSQNKSDNVMKHLNIRTLLIAEGFGFLFSLSCVWGLTLDRSDVLFAAPSVFVLALVESILLSVPVCVLLYLFAAKCDNFGVKHQPARLPEEKLQQIDEVKKTEDTGAIEKLEIKDDAPTDRKKYKSKVSFVAFLFMIVCWIPVFLAYYPSVFTYDAEGQMYQVIAYDYSTHHPLVHTLFLGLFLRAGEMLHSINLGMALHSVVQMLLMAGMFAYAIGYLYEIGTRKLWLVVLAIFYGLFPTNSVLVLSTTKDILFSGLVLVFTVCLHRWMKDAQQGKTFRKKDFLTLTVMTVCMLLFRNNAVYALLSMTLLIGLVLLFTKIRGQKTVLTSACGKLAVIFAASVVLYLVVSAGLKIGTGAHSGSPREMLSVPIQQMARVRMLRYEEMTGEEQAAIENVISSEWYERYNAHLADPMKERISLDQPATFVKTWIRFGLRSLGDYVDAFLLTEEGCWYLFDKSSHRIYGEGSATGFGYLSTDIRHMPAGYEVTNASVLPGVRDWFEQLVSDNAFERIPVVRILFQPALYFWLLMLLLYRSIVAKKRIPLVVMLFLCMYYLTLLLSPAVLMRYMYPFMVTVPVLLVMPGMLYGKEDAVKSECNSKVTFDDTDDNR